MNGQIRAPATLPSFDRRLILDVNDHDYNSRQNLGLYIERNLYLVRTLDTIELT
jgi:hypothetical protein